MLKLSLSKQVSSVNGQLRGVFSVRNNVLATVSPHSTYNVSIIPDSINSVNHVKKQNAPSFLCVCFSVTLRELHRLVTTWPVPERKLMTVGPAPPRYT